MFAAHPISKVASQGGLEGPRNCALAARNSKSGGIKEGSFNMGKSWLSLSPRKQDGGVRGLRSLEVNPELKPRGALGK